jgi:hypothetical protein
MKTSWWSKLAVLVGVLAAVGGNCNCKPEVVDEPASNLEAKASFIDTDETPSDGKQPVVVQFFKGGKFVQLSGNAAIACNGVPLTWNGLGYAERVPLVPPGGTYTITHARAAVTTTMNVTVPPRPTITTPASGANATRSAAFEIVYPPGGGTSVRPGAHGPAGGLTGASQPDDGTATVDASGTGAGAGTVSLVRDLEGAVGGTGFSAARFTYATGKSQPVVWQ